MKSKILLTAIILIAIFLRFYNLNFGSPYYFNPDERNMAIAITKLEFPKSMNPHFFAYGQLPLYLSYFSQRAVSVTFGQGIFWLRFWSATASTLTVLLVFLISRKLLTFHFSLLTSALCAVTPGLIQSAHFGTTESLLTFFFMLIIYLSIIFKGQILQSIILGVVTGLALSTKTSALVFLLVPILTIFIFKQKFYKKLLLLFLLFIFTFLLFIFTSPFNILDFQALRGSLNYESSVALGKTKVFYTRQFENTIPILFQIEKIFPYALGVPIFIFGLLGFLFTFKRSKTYFILTFSFLVYFLANAFLFAKWTRFMTPIFPLFAVFTGLFFSQIYIKLKSFRFLTVVLTFAFCVLSLLPGIVFFSIYLRPDIRVTASEWIYDNVPSGSYVLSETANVIDIPISIPSYNLNVISFNFYELDNEPNLINQLVNHLGKADYIFIPSRRIFANHLQYPEKYPLTSKYYQLLFSGKLGFKKASEFYVLNDERAEETFSVFDHPKIRIYKKNNNMTSGDYMNLLTKPNIF